MDPPIARYAHSGVTSIAYQIFGTGEIDLLFAMGPASHLDLQWEHPLPARFLGRLGRFARVVMFDRRGMGLSDPVDRAPTYEQQVEDAVAVLDAVGMKRVALLASSEAGHMAEMLAATHPARVTSLALISPVARAAKEIRRESVARILELISNEWGAGKTLSIWGPHLVADAEFAAWWSRLERAAASPGMARRYAELVTTANTADVLGAVRAPTLVVHRRGDPVIPEAESREVSQLIPGARLVVLDGDGTFPYMSDPGPLLDEIEEFLTGHRGTGVPDTVLASVLFTDIVGSTDLAQRLGDSGWRELLGAHDDAIHRQVRRFGGRTIKDLGDGFMISFDGPARALACARACVDTARAVGVTIRAGVHIGECIRRDDDLGGVAIHVAARISALARGGEVLCSSTVKDLVIGSGMHFDDRGEHQLKGVAGGAWRLYALSDGRDARDT